MECPCAFLDSAESRSDYKPQECSIGIKGLAVKKTQVECVFSMHSN